MTGATRTRVVFLGGKESSSDAVAAVMHPTEWPITMYWELRGRQEETRESGQWKRGRQGKVAGNGGRRAFVCRQLCTVRIFGYFEAEIIFPSMALTIASRASAATHRWLERTIRRQARGLETNIITMAKMVTFAKSNGR